MATSPTKNLETFENPAAHRDFEQHATEYRSALKREHDAEPPAKAASVVAASCVWV